MDESLKSNLKDQLPELFSTQNLVDLGFWPNQDAAYLARRKGHSPDYIKVGAKILYPKSSVITFIEKHLKNGGTPYKTFKSEKEKVC